MSKDPARPKSYSRPLAGPEQAGKTGKETAAPAIMARRCFWSGHEGIKPLGAGRKRKRRIRFRMGGPTEAAGKFMVKKRSERLKSKNFSLRAHAPNSVKG